MDDPVPPSVEFVGGASGPGAEELLGEPRPGNRRTVVLTLLGAVLLVVVVVAVIAGRRDDRGPGVAASSPAPSAVITSGPVPVAGGPGSAVVRNCPAHAACSVWVRAPATTLAALHAAFPGAVVETVTTVLANRVGHFEPDLVSRELLARDGKRTIRVCIRGGAAAGGTSDRGGPASTQDARVTVQRGGFRISVVVSGPAATTELSRAAGLAGDPRLTAPL